MFPLCCIAFACTSPEHHVSDAGDTAGLKYNENRELNTTVGPASSSDTKGAAGLDSSNAPKDTSRPIKKR